MAKIAHVVEARLARKRPRHDLELCDLTAAEFGSQLAQLFLLLGRSLLGIIDLKANLLAGEACAVDKNVDAVNAVGEDLEEFLAVDRRFHQRI